ncbi:hypothetical protein ABIB85_006091 [Bradyrhizobium sp. JR1.5]
MFENCRHSSDQRGCTGRSASDGSADAMLPAHEGPLAAFTCATPRRPVRRLISESACRSSFRPQMHQPVCPQRVYAERHNHYNKVLLRHNRMTNRNMAGITSKRAGSTMTAITLRIDAPVDDLDLLGSQIGTVEMVRESVLARPTCSGDHRRDNLSQLPIYPDGKMMELARTASSFACCGPAGPRDGRLLWKRWCVPPTVSCPRCRQTIMN